MYIGNMAKKIGRTIVVLASTAGSRLKFIYINNIIRRTLNFDLNTS